MSIKLKCTICNTEFESEECSLRCCKCGRHSIVKSSNEIRVNGDICALRVIENGVEKSFINEELIKVEPNKEKLKDYPFLIFLDIDGVLNNTHYIEYCYTKNGNHPMSMSSTPFDPRNLEYLMHIVRYIESKGYEVNIVLSSTWRLSEVDYSIVHSRLAEYGMRLAGKTPMIGANRGKEIQSYLNSNKYIGYIIIDDDTDDMLDYMHDYVIPIDSLIGLQRDDLLIAQSIVDKITKSVEEN